MHVTPKSDQSCIVYRILTIYLCVCACVHMPYQSSEQFHHRSHILKKKTNILSFDIDSILVYMPRTTNGEGVDTHNQ